MKRPRILRLRKPWVLLAGATFAALCCAPGADSAEVPDEGSVRAILDEVPLIDGHNDVPWQYKTRVRNHLDAIDFTDTTRLDPPMHTDLRRLSESGIGAQFWSVYVPSSYDGPGAARAVLEQIDVVHRLVERHPQRLEMAYTADDIETIHAAGRVASLIGMEGGHAIENSLGVLRQLYRAGARYMTLTHSQNIAWADSATDEPVLGGLSAFGREVVREMNRLGMLVDLSHVSADTMRDVLDVTESPVIFSHSSAFAVTAHPRNVPDDVLARMSRNGGVVMVTFVPPFINEDVRRSSADLSAERERLAAIHGNDTAAIERALIDFDGDREPPEASLDDVADHIDHIRDVAGVDHIGIGSDYDGITSVPRGLEDVSKLPDLLDELLRNRGYSVEDLEKICGRNVLRVMRANEANAARIRVERTAVDAHLDELDG